MEDVDMEEEREIRRLEGGGGSAEVREEEGTEMERAEEGGRVTLEGVLRRKRERGAELAAMRERVEREMDEIMGNGVVVNAELVAAAQRQGNASARRGGSTHGKT